jgi:cellulose synthase/poly-beta-1,6-N-acetylglucosamine synthase-like glycosyltransferase
MYCLFLAIGLQGWQKLPKLVFAAKSSYRTRMSLVIAARNEESTIALCLADFAAQTYPKELFEIVIADDNSTDNTVSVIKVFMANNPSITIKLLELKDEPGIVSYKKRALSAAITASSNELIVTTDADCRFGPQRLEVIAKHYEDNPVSLILLPVVFNNEKSLFEKIQSLEFTGIMGITAASAGIGRPVSSNGANMAIERRLFERIGGFDDPYASGDDVFILYKTKLVAPKRIAFIKSEEAIVYTSAQKNVSGFFNQRVRWGAKAKGFSDVSALVSILLLFFSNLMVTAVMVLGLVFLPLIMPALIIFGLKLIADMVFLLPVTRFYKKTGLLVFYPLMSLWLPIYISITGILSLRGNYVWKGRKLH